MNDATRALKIAELIAECDSEYRGDLLVSVAEELRLQNQWYTAAALEKVGLDMNRANYHAKVRM